MTIGKNKRVNKQKKGGKKKAGDPFLKKEWYELKAPSIFMTRNFGRTLVNKTQGTKLATDGLRGRIFEVNLADLQNNDEDQGFRKIKLCCEEVQGKACLTDFHGMDITRDKLCSLVRKWHTLIEAFVDVKTQDGYLLRMFCIAFTKRHPEQVRINCYANSNQIRLIRAKMVEIMSGEASKVTLRNLVKKFIPESIGKAIEHDCRRIFPLQNVFIRKVKVIKKPKFDLSKLMELHQETEGDKGARMVEKESDGAKNLLSSEVKADA